MIETLLIRGQQSFFDVLVGLGQSRAILSGYDYGGVVGQKMEGDGCQCRSGPDAGMCWRFPVTLTER
jgi:hypothetical protein